MSRRIVGYVDGRAVWEDLGPAENVAWGHALGGQAIEQRAPIRRPGDPNSPGAIRKREHRTFAERDYLASSLKGHATRRAKAEA